uniref:MFS transporter n=1 Tax=Cyberlindnera americana TaxID=36016 RepID=A0A5P8N8H7_9ASCO|nr:MFS transporter [Cyberlindnera americana]
MDVLLTKLPKQKARDTSERTEEIGVSNSVFDWSRTNSSFSETNVLNSTISHSSNISVDGEDEYPEGGLSAYLAVFGCFLGLIPAFGISCTVGAIQTYISSNQLVNVSTSTISWIFSLFNFTSYASAIFSGAYFDHSGSRRPLTVGTILFVSGLMGTSESTKVWHFILSFGIVLGFGTGILTSPLISVVSHYFNRKRATYTSLATLGASVGGIFFPMLLKGLYPKVGFPWAMRIFAFICMGFLICSIVLSKERVRKEKPIVNDLRSFINNNLLEIFDYRGFKELRFSCVVAAVTLGEVSLMSTSIYFPSYALMRGYSADTSYLLVTITNAAGIGGRIIPGYLSDRYFGPFNTVIVTNFFAILSMWVVWLPFGEKLNALYAYAVLYGFFSGSIYSLSPVLVGQVSRTEDFGKRYSSMYMITACAMLVSIPVAGAIIGDGQVKNYDFYIIYSSITGISSVLLHMFTRYKSVGYGLSKA